MKIQDMLGMIGGLSLFLFGMNMMSGGLEKIAGNHLEMILKKLTYNKWKAVFTGIVVTALIHSSSAMTVMLIGFVNSGLMPLENAIWVGGKYRYNNYRTNVGFRCRYFITFISFYWSHYVCFF